MKEPKYEVINFKHAPISQKDIITEEADEGIIIRGIPIFKVGTYRGKKYDEKYIDEKIIATFNPAENVPVQADHLDSYEKTLGYVKKLYRDGKMLLADMHLLADNAIARWRKGLMKKWSASIYYNGKGLREVSAVAFPYVKEASVLAEGDEEYEVKITPKGPKIKREIIAIDVHDDDKENLSGKNGEINYDEETKIWSLILDTPATDSLGSKTDPTHDGKTDNDGDNANKNKNMDEEKNMDEKKIDELAELKAKEMLKEAGEKEEKLTADLDVKTKEAEKLAEDKEKLEKSLEEKEIREKIAKFKADGKVLPAEEDQTVAFSLKLDEEARKEYFGMIEKSEKKVDLSEEGKQKSEKEEEENKEDAKYKIDLDEASAEDIEALIDKYAEDKGVPVDDARDILYEKNAKKQE